MFISELSFELLLIVENELVANDLKVLEFKFESVMLELSPFEDEKNYLL